MKRVSRYKGAGYLTSTVSVILLAIVSLKGAMKDPLLLAALIAGALASIAGMGLRWRSHRLEQREKEALEREVKDGGD